MDQTNYRAYYAYDYSIFRASQINKYNLFNQKEYKQIIRLIVVLEELEMVLIGRNVKGVNKDEV